MFDKPTFTHAFVVRLVWNLAKLYNIRCLIGFFCPYIHWKNVLMNTFALTISEGNSIGYMINMTVFIWT